MSLGPLSRRERQIVEILYRLGEATVADIHQEMPDATYSGVRGLLRVLHEKGVVIYRAEGVRHVYAPAAPREAAAKSALNSLVANFFGGSVEEVVSTLLHERERSLSPEELERLSKLIEQARRNENG
jgi:BlaI family transcriptional regulator, penicillinase repressor